MTRKTLFVAGGIALCLGQVAHAEPLRLRADVFANAEPPVGLLILQGEDNHEGWLSTEALVWTGVDELDDEHGGDVLVVSARLRDPKGRGEARVGRFIVATGAIRPTHIDGASVLARSTWGTNLEVFGGLPVVPRFGVDADDWIVGTRASHRLGDLMTAGVSYYHHRDRGILADEEVGFDFAAAPAKWLDLATRASIDAIHPGLADARISAASRFKSVRMEAFAARRSPSRVLPATSLFAVLGDVPSDEVGLSGRWRAAPRLSVWVTAAVRSVDEDVGYDVSTRSDLHLDDDKGGLLQLELHRQQLTDDSSFSGVRTAARLPVGRNLTGAVELELVVPDDARGRGKVWPWTLCAMSWRFAEFWDAAAAGEVHSSPTSEIAITGLLRLSRAWGSP